MTTLTVKIGVLLLGVGLIFAGGVWLGHRIWAEIPRSETPATAVVLLDGSVMLARDAGAGAKPAQAIPAGAKPIRIIKVVVKPGPVAPPATSGTAPQDGGTSTGPSTPTNPCPPIRVDLTLVKMPDGSQRVIASSPDGQIDANASLDIPVPDAPAVKVPRVANWGVGAVYGGGTNGAISKGALVMRRVLGPIWAGGEVTRDTFSNQTAGWSGRLAVIAIF